MYHDTKHHLNCFGLGGAVKPGEKVGDRPNEFMTTVFFGQPLALPGFAKYSHIIKQNVNISWELPTSMEIPRL